MSLRNLVFDIAFNGSASPILEMNSAADELTQTTMGATENIEGMETATDELGRTSDSVGRLLEENWKKVTVAAGAAGAAIEAMARGQAEMTQQTQQVAASLGITEDAMRDLALETTNVTFPLEDVIDLFEIGRQQGIKSAEALQEYAWFWDTVGDATGENATELAKGSQGLRAVGIAAGEEEQALSAFGYVTENTTSTVTDLLSFLERTGPELRELGLDINDTAAIMGILEHEMGMSGRTARSEFRSAVSEADGEVALMLDNLGIAPGVFQDYQSAVDSSSDIIQRNADLHAQTYTKMQKFQQKVSELAYEYAPLIQSAADYAPLLLALGPAMKGVSTISSIWGKVNLTTLIPSLKGVATALLASPITWIVVAIIGLVGTLVYLYKTNETVKESIDSIWNKIKTIFSLALDFIGYLVQSATDVMKGLWNKFGDDIISVGSFVWDIITNLISSALSIIEGALDMFIGVFTGDWEMAWEGAKTVITSALEFFNTIPTAMFDIGVNIISGLVNGIKSMGKNAADAAIGIATSVGDGIKGFFGINSPAKLTMEYGVNVGEGLELGMSDTIPELETTTRQISEIIAPNLNKDSDDFDSRINKELRIAEAPLSGAITNNSNSMVFNPTITVQVGNGTNAREAANSLEKEFNALMERYAKKLQYRNPALTEG